MLSEKQYLDLYQSSSRIIKKNSDVSKRVCEILGLDQNNSKIITCHIGNGGYKWISQQNQFFLHKMSKFGFLRFPNTERHKRRSKQIE